MNNNKSEDKKDIKLLIILLFYLISAILIPTLIWGMYHKISWESWNSMILSYTGGAIGGIATLIAIYLTLKQNDNNSKEAFNLQVELKRVDVIPYLNIEALSKKEFSKSIFSNETDKQYSEDYTNKNPSGYFIFENNNVTFCQKLDEKYIIELSSPVKLIPQKSEGANLISRGSIEVNNSFEQPLELTNIGLGTAINVKLDLYNSDNELLHENIEVPFNIAVNAKSIFRLVFLNYPEGKYYFKFSVTDIYGKNFYCQKYNFEYQKNTFIFGNIESPKIIEEYH